MLLTPAARSMPIRRPADMRWSMILQNPGIPWSTTEKERPVRYPWREGRSSGRRSGRGCREAGRRRRGRNGCGMRPCGPDGESRAVWMRAGRSRWRGPGGPDGEIRTVWMRAGRSGWRDPSGPDGGARPIGVIQIGENIHAVRHAKKSSMQIHEKCPKIQI